MNDNSANNSDHAFAKKQHADEFRVIVIVQIVALVTAGLSFIIGGIFLTIIGVSVSCVAAIVNFYKLTYSQFTQTGSLPTWMKIYCRWGLVYIPLCALLIQASSFIHILSLIGMILFWLFPFYSVIPQFYIAHWLAEATRDLRINNVPI